MPKSMRADRPNGEGADLGAILARHRRQLVRRCGALAVRGTGVGVCDGALDAHGECVRYGSHVDETDVR